MAIKHLFQSVKPVSTDTSKVRSNDWNADHEVDDIETTSGHFFWDNTAKRLLQGFAGVYTNVRAVIMELKNNDLPWTTLSNLWFGFRVSVGNLPDNCQFGSDLVGIPQVITGTLDLPSNATFANAGSALAGYGRSSSTALGGLGIMGVGLVNANSVPGVWGSNYLSPNTGTIHNAISHALPPGPGYNLTNLYGCEIDMGVHPLAGGAAPYVNARSLYLVLGGSIQSTANVINCIDLEIIDSNVCKWINAINLPDGASSNAAINIGATNVGIESGSQEIKFKSRNSSGVVKACRIFSSNEGALYLKSDDSAFTVLPDTDMTSIADAGFGRFRVVKKFVMEKLTPPVASASPGDTGHILYDDDFIYIRVNNTTWKRCALSTW